MKWVEGVYGRGGVWTWGHGWGEELSALEQQGLWVAVAAVAYKVVGALQGFFFFC